MSCFTAMYCRSRPDVHYVLLPVLLIITRETVYRVLLRFNNYVLVSGLICTMF